MAVEKYTDEMLTHNFNLLKGFMATSDRDFDTLWDTVFSAERRIEALEKAGKATKVVVKAHKRSKLLVIGVVAGSAYLGYKLAQSSIEASFQGPKYDAKKAANTQTVNDVEKD